MNEIENEFRTDIHERKQLAHSAKKRICGSNSKKCTLPSDHLSSKYMFKMNGEVITVQFKHPISWEVFKQLSISSQQYYLSTLQEKFECGVIDIAKRIFKVDYATLKKYMDDNSLQITSYRGNRKKDSEKFTNWLVFLGRWKKDFVTSTEHTPVPAKEIDKPDESENIEDVISEDIEEDTNTTDPIIKDDTDGDNTANADTNESDDCSNPDDDNDNVIHVDSNAFNITINGTLKKGETYTIKITRE